MGKFIRQISFKYHREEQHKQRKEQGAEKAADDRLLLCFLQQSNAPPTLHQGKQSLSPCRAVLWKNTHTLAACPAWSLLLTARHDCAHHQKVLRTG